MRKHSFTHLIAWLILLLPNLSHAQVATVQAPFLLPTDTIFLHRDPDGSQWFPHTLRPGQSLYSVAQFYGISLNTLYAYNPDFRGRPYQIGEQVRIPLPNRAIIRYKSPYFVASEFLPVCYVVRKGDTVFGIAKRLFKMPIDTIVRRNQLPDYTIEVGQALHIGWMSVHGIPDSLHRKHRGPLWDKSYALEKQFDEAALKHSIKFFQGAAFQIETDKKQSSSGLYALCDKARKGSIIAIKNPMNNREVFAKVLGPIPTNYPSNIIVVIPSDIAQMLGGLDAKFFIHLRYF